MSEAPAPCVAAAPAAWNASLYDASHSFVWKLGGALVELLAPRPGERILDLGCGTGHLTAQIAQSGADVLGFDSSPEMIDQARRAHPAVRFEIGDARDFSFGADSDAVFSNAVLHWVKEPDSAAARIFAALGPGGRFVAEFGGKGNTRLLADALLRQAAALGMAEYELPWYYPGVAAYAAILERHGLEVVFARLYDRSTPLEGEGGLKNWFEMFCGSLLDRLLPDQRARCLTALEHDLRPVLYRDGRWHADYRRLQIVAVRPS